MSYVHMIFRAVFSAVLLIVMGNALAADTDPSPVEMGGVFTVQLDNAKGCNTVKPLDQVNLLVKGIDSGIHPIGCDPATNKLAFELTKTSSMQDNTASRAVWGAMLGNIWKSNPGFNRSMDYTVTQPTGAGTEVLSSGKLNLHLLKPGRAMLGISLVVIIVVALLYLVKKTGIVRDSGRPGTTVEHRTYSLGRVQMAWWLAIILSAYIYLWMVTDGLPAMSSQALGLMGISGASGLISLGVDSSKQTTFPVSSGNLITDILTDADGVTIHRFQMLVMTVTLGIFFAVHVATHLSMPEFDSNTLAMLGISGLTYVGFKVPERHDTTPPISQLAGNTTENTDPKSGYSPDPESPIK